MVAAAHNTECNARTAADIRLHAEKAAFQAQPLITFFNGLQKRTFRKLSPETRAFAEVCYERKLVRLVAAALLECACSFEGRATAAMIASAEGEGDLKSAWKPLVDQCSQLLRSVKMETTMSRLNRLSDQWSRSEHGRRQGRRLREAVLHASSDSLKSAKRVVDDILDWIELYSLPQAPLREITRFGDYKNLERFSRNLVVVDKSETFSEAEAFLEREVAREPPVYVIVGNDDDAARFYKRIVDRFGNYGVLLNWRDKKYGSLDDPKIEIGNIDYFVRKMLGMCGDTKASAVFLHVECRLEESFDIQFQQGNLDEYIAKLFVLVTITMEHFLEIEATFPDINSNLVELISSWPKENQVLYADRVQALWEKCNKSYRDPTQHLPQFISHLRRYVTQFVEAKIKQCAVPQHLRAHVEKHGSKFVWSAFVARDAEIGQDYIVYADRSSGSLNLRVRVKKPLLNDWGLQQFLEMRHGCAVTPYKVANASKTAADLVKTLDHVLIIHRSNPFRSHSAIEKSLGNVVIRQEVHGRPLSTQTSINHFTSTASIGEKDCLYIFVCCTNELLDETFAHLKEARAENVLMCETALGAATETAKNPAASLAVCTTAAHFEGWTYVPRTRRNMRIIVCRHAMDNTALEVACDLADASEIYSSTFHNDYWDRIKRFNDARASASSYIKEKFDELRTGVQILFDEAASDPVALIDRYFKDDDINCLTEAKLSLHRTLRNLSVTAKMVHARLPAKQLSSDDSPTDIACQGFVEQARSRMDDVNAIRRQVERLLSAHGLKQGLHKATVSKYELQTIAGRHSLHVDDLIDFIRTLRSTSRPESWNDVRKKVELQFKLEMDASEQWERIYRDGREERSDIGLVALSAECKSAATAFLPNLKLADWPANHQQVLIQCSDRHLVDCTMYHSGPGLDLAALLEMDGSSFEYVAPASTTSEFEDNEVNAAAKHRSLYLHPRRCYDRLTKDLFDGCLLVSEDYAAGEQQMHPYDRVQLPLIAETTRRSRLERLLRAESALMEFGSHSWMQWMARRLKQLDYHEEVVAFYHRIIAERDYCVRDERIIERIRESFEKRDKVKTAADQRRLNAFVYSTMDALREFGRLVIIDPPPAVNNEALNQLSAFIRSRRMPPP